MRAVAGTLVVSPVSQMGGAATPAGGVDLALTLEVRDGRGALVKSKEGTRAIVPEMWCVVENRGNVDVPPLRMKWRTVGSEEERTPGLESVACSMEIPAIRAHQRQCVRLDAITREGGETWAALICDENDKPYEDAHRSNNHCVRDELLRVSR